MGMGRERESGTIPFPSPPPEVRVLWEEATKEGTLASLTWAPLCRLGPPQGAGLGLPLRSASPPAGLCSLHEAPQTQRPYMVTEPQARQLEGTLEGHLAQQPFSNHRCF